MLNALESKVLDGCEACLDGCEACAICEVEGVIDLCSLDAVAQSQQALGAFTKKKQVRGSRV
jgi:hypothetical protein